jgi:hypothetical protein
MDHATLAFGWPKRFANDWDRYTTAEVLTGVRVPYGVQAHNLEGPTSLVPSHEVRILGTVLLTRKATMTTMDAAREGVAANPETGIGEMRRSDASTRQLEHGPKQILEANS